MDFFVDSIENWRKKVDITNFHLIGHSFGGYLSGFYAMKYENHVKKLICLSPAGTSYITDEENEKMIEKRK